MMTAIKFGAKVNRRKILLEVLKEMADRTTKRAKGFAAQICVLLKGDPAVTLGEAKTFPPLKIIYAKMVNTYIATNKTIDARGESDEPEVAKVAIVKNKSVSKKKSASIADKDADDVHVEVVAEKAVSTKRPAADISLPSPHQSPSIESSMHFNTDDIPLGTETSVEHILFTSTTAPATDLSEQFAQLRVSISQLSIKQLKTQSSIGNLQNHLLSIIDELEKASANARTQQDQHLRGHFKSVRQEIQIKKTALSFEVLEFKQGVRAQSGIFSTELADIRKEIKDQSMEFDDKFAAIRNDLLEFRVATQEQYSTLRDDLAGLIAFVTKGRDDKKWEVSSSHGRGQPPPGDGGVVVAGVSHHEKEEAVDLCREIGDIG
ncbi:hypothetical protein F511_16730 [Dorcoceras hygrometricum]|uniref:Uncharacterized protein n=1 Tax=Dorcoceras hygrometricum TaxID=472368 RepID=A0A2Z7BAP4_9LAMI|nr:hypothetical protein F511_16730 [Dorcoceras hygrometricum]